MKGSGSGTVFRRLSKIPRRFGLAREQTRGLACEPEESVMTSLSCSATRFEISKSL